VRLPTNTPPSNIKTPVRVKNAPLVPRSAENEKVPPTAHRPPEKEKALPSGTRSADDQSKEDLALRRKIQIYGPIFDPEYSSGSEGDGEPSRSPYADDQSNDDASAQAGNAITAMPPKSAAMPNSDLRGSNGRIKIRTHGGSPPGAGTSTGSRKASGRRVSFELPPPTPATSSQPAPPPGLEPPSSNSQTNGPAVVLSLRAALPEDEPAVVHEPAVVLTPANHPELTRNDFPEHPLSMEVNTNRETFNQEFFETYGERVGFREHIKANYNEALKYFRLLGSKDDKNFELPRTPLSIPPFSHEERGTKYHTVDGPPNAFGWLEMIAHILNKEPDEEDGLTGMQRVVGVGVVSCCFKKDPSIYAHAVYQNMSNEEKRAKSAKDEVEKMWDFVIVRADGSECALHPSFTKNHLGYRDVRGPGGVLMRTGPPQVPKAGPGKSDGHGTFKRMKKNAVDRTLKWDIGTFRR